MLERVWYFRRTVGMASSVIIPASYDGHGKFTNLFWNGS